MTADATLIPLANILTSRAKRRMRQKPHEEVRKGLQISLREKRLWYRLYAFLLMLASVFTLSSCGSAVNLIGVEADPPTSEVLANDNTHRIYIMTTRAASDVEGVFFSGERSRALNFASVDVSIPPNHQPGNVELARRPPPDPRKHMVFHNVKVFPDNRSFRAELLDVVNRTERGTRKTLVFVHGYNTNMTEAVARFAQLIEDTGYEGVPILFSWPSSRRVLDYVTDINSAAFSRDALADSAVLLNTVPFEGIDILAHSMGNFLVMETARTMSLRGDFNRLNRLQTVILASPDIDFDVFEKQLDAIPSSQHSKFSVLVSQDDRALRIAQSVAGGTPRAGAADPMLLAELGLNVVDLTQIDDRTSTHHTKFANSPEIVRTLGERLSEGDTLSTQTSEAGIAIQRVGGVFEIFQIQ